MTQEQDTAISRSSNVQLGLVISIVVGMGGFTGVTFAGYRWLSSEFEKSRLEIAKIQIEIEALNKELELRAGDRYTSTDALAWTQAAVLLNGEPLPDPRDPSKVIEYRGPRQ